MNCDQYYFYQVALGFPFETCKEVEATMTPPATASTLPANACTGCQCPRDDTSWREYDVGVACDVVDGSAFSSQAPCMCGGTRCKQSEVCTYSPFVELCQRSGALVLRSPCMLGGSPLIFEYEFDTYFDAPVYSAVGGYYLYWDYGCAGVIGSPAIWVLDTDEPARAPRQTDLDGDSACNVLAYINSYEISGPPSGTQNWTISCDTGADKESEIIIEHLYGPLPAVESTGDACPCTPWATATSSSTTLTVTTSATSTSTVTLSGTTTTFATETVTTGSTSVTSATTATTTTAGSPTTGVSSSDPSDFLSLLSVVGITVGVLAAATALALGLCGGAALLVRQRCGPETGVGTMTDFPPSDDEDDFVVIEAWEAPVSMGENQRDGPVRQIVRV